MKSHNGCCSTIGDRVKSIPLDTITDCGIAAQDSGCGKCYTGAPSIYIDTASSGGNAGQNASRHEAVGYGLSGYDWLVTEIIARRDTLKGHNHHLSSPQPPPPIYNGMDRGESSKKGESVESRFQKIKDLRNLGLLDESEYEKKRQEIIASI